MIPTNEPTYCGDLYINHESGVNSIDCYLADSEGCATLDYGISLLSYLCSITVYLQTSNNESDININNNNNIDYFTLSSQFIPWGTLVLDGGNKDLTFVDWTGIPTY